MHDAAFRWVAGCVGTFGPFRSVVEFGGFDVNGTVRGLFGDVPYVSVDVKPGRGVDVVADASVWRPDEPVSCVVCCEVFEHTAVWREIVANAEVCLTAGGVFIGTCAGAGRAEHAADGGPSLPAGEFYSNVERWDLESVLSMCFREWSTDVQGTDLRWWAVK